MQFENKDFEEILSNLKECRKWIAYTEAENKELLRNHEIVY